MPYPDVVEMPMFVALDGTPAIVAVRLVNFEVNHHELKPGHKAWIANVGADAVLSSPNSWVNILGYASKTGTPEYNLELSKKRAKEAKLELGLQVSMRGGIFGDNRVTIEHGFGEDHPAYIADPNTDESPNWRAVEIIIFGKRPSIVYPPKKKPENLIKEFEIRILDTISFVLHPDIPVSPEVYRFEIKDLQRREKGVFVSLGLNASATLEGISVPLPFVSGAWGAGPPKRFKTNKPILLSELDGSNVSINVGAGISGAVTIGGDVRLNFTYVFSKVSGGVFVTPNPVIMQTGMGMMPGSAGSVGRGKLKLVGTLETY